MGNAFVDGFKEGMSQAEEAHEQGTTNISAGILSPMTLSLWPKSLAATSDKLFNQKDQEWYPASHIKTLVWAKSKDVGIARYVSFLILIGLFFIIKAIIQFYKLINAINHEVIFDWMNVRRFESHRTQSADLFHTDTSLYDNELLGGNPIIRVGRL